MDFTLYFPIVFLIIVGILVVIVAVISMATNRAQTQQNKRYKSRRQIYTPGAFSGQMELDIRLPYRRFRQLYPNSKLTYREYKQLQMSRAFRRSMSSQENKRMVR